MRKHDTDIIFINPPSLFERPEMEQPGTLYIPAGLRMRAMNPGIVSMASFLKQKGYGVDIIDASLDLDYEHIKRKIEDSDAAFYGISSMTGYDYCEALTIANYVAEIHPESKILFGGQHAGPLGRTVLEDCEKIDMLCRCEGELVCEEILKRYKHGITNLGEIPGTVIRDGHDLRETEGSLGVVDLNELPFNKYELYPNFQTFTPFVEESRGCIHRCRFCNSNVANRGNMRFKRPERFLAEMEYCYSLYGDTLPYAVLTSTFGVIPHNGKKIAEGMKKFNITWGTEFRADSEWEYFLDEMYESGYDVASIGLESGSPTILRYMGKTKSPEIYLRRMQELAREVKKRPRMSTKLNFIFYAGETPQTVRETISFLSKTPEIDAIIFSPLILIQGTPVMENFNYFVKKYGAEMIRSAFWDRRHFHPVKPSKYFSFKEISCLGHTLEKIFSDERIWIEAQKYSYSIGSNSDEIWKALKRSRFCGDD